MRTIRHIITSAMLVIWMLVCDGLLDVIYAKLGAMVGREHFHQLERSLGVLKFHITNDNPIEFWWFRIVVTITILTLLTMPAVWLIKRGR